MTIVSTERVGRLIFHLVEFASSVGFPDLNDRASLMFQSPIWTFPEFGGHSQKGEGVSPHILTLKRGLRGGWRDTPLSLPPLFGQFLT